MSTPTSRTQTEGAAAGRTPLPVSSAAGKHEGDQTNDETEQPDDGEKCFRGMTHRARPEIRAQLLTR